MGKAFIEIFRAIVRTPFKLSNRFNFGRKGLKRFNGQIDAVC